MVVDKVRLYLKLDNLGRPEGLDGFDPVSFSDLEKALFASGADRVCICSGAIYKKVHDDSSTLSEKDEQGNIVKGVGWSPYRFLTYELVQK